MDSTRKDVSLAQSAAVVEKIKKRKSSQPIVVFLPQNMRNCCFHALFFNAIYFKMSFVLQTRLVPSSLVNRCTMGQLEAVPHHRPLPPPPSLPPAAPGGNTAPRGLPSYVFSVCTTADRCNVKVGGGGFGGGGVDCDRW